jgi:hypothetical protein
MPLSAQQASEAGTRLLADALVAGDTGADTDPDGDGPLLRTVARHLVDFLTWRSLVIQQGLVDLEAVEIAVRLLTAMVADRHRRDEGGPGS